MLLDRSFPALALAAGLVLGGPMALTACSQPPSAAPLAPVPLASVDEPLIVNGEAVPEAVLKRTLVYLLGSRDLKSRVLDLQIEAEKQKQLDEGVDPERFEILDEELAAAKARLMEQLAEQYPEMDPAEIMLINGMQIENLERQFRQTQLFDAVFLPEDPEMWSDRTHVLLEGSGGPELVDKLKESFALRQEQGLELDPNDPGVAMWKNIMRQLVMQGLNKATVVETAADGLPAELCMRVDGLEVTTEEMYDEISSRVSEADMRRVRVWVAKTEAMRQALEAADHWISDAEFTDRFAEHEKPYVGSPIPLEFVATGLQKFPSMEIYRQYYRLRESFRDMIADELTDEGLAEHLDRANLMMGLAQVEAEVIWIAATNPRTGQPVEDGWADARERAVAATTALAEGGLDAWDATLDEYSDFWDPPAPPPNPQAPAQPPAKKNKGRFGALNRNDFLQRMGESDFQMFLTGESIADHVFFDQEPGTVSGPFTGENGYYICKLNRRGNSTRPPLSLDNPNQRELVLQDYLSVRMNEYARQVLENAEVQGLY